MNHKKTLIASTVALTFLLGFALAAVLLPPRYIYLTVEEAVSIAPESVAITMFVGETKDAVFTVTNLASISVPLSITAEVTLVPEGGSATDVTLTYASTLDAAPGDTALTISVALATGAVPGDYAVTVTPTRM